MIQDGDVLISWSASLGVYEWKNGNAWLNQHIFKVKFDKIPFEKSFFKYVISAKLDHMSSVAHGATMKHITKKNFDEITIPYPPLLEQRRLAEILSTVNLLIEQRKHQIEKLDLLAKSRFIEMFGDPVTNPMNWNKVRLSAIIVHANNGMARRGCDTEGDIVLRLVELQNGYIDYSSPNRIVLSEAEKARYRLQDKDFLFARVNGNPENVGRCAFFTSIQSPIYHNDHIIRVRFSSDVDVYFMSHLLNSPYGKLQMKDKIKTSAGQYTINQEGLGSIEIYLPPLALQNEFAAFIEQLDKSKFTIRRSLEKLEMLYQALLQEYFG